MEGEWEGCAIQNSTKDQEIIAGMKQTVTLKLK